MLKCYFLLGALTRGRSNLVPDQLEIGRAASPFWRSGLEAPDGLLSIPVNEVIQLQSLSIDFLQVQ